MLTSLSQRRVKTVCRHSVVAVSDEPRGEFVTSNYVTIEAPLPVIKKLREQVPVSIDIPSLQRLCSGPECSGVIIVRNHNKQDYVFAGAFTGTTIYWSRDRSGNILVAASSELLAQQERAELDYSAVVLALVDSLPPAASARTSLRQGIKAVPALDVLVSSGDSDVDIIQGWRPKALALSEAEIFSSLRHRILQLTSKRAARTARVMVDISGGVDSAVNAYALKALRGQFVVFHACADSKWNNDTEWSVKIANDLGTELLFSDRLSSTSFSFNTTDRYGNGALLDQPLMWSDTEGYMRDLARWGEGQPRCHLMGLGGDELFTPMPSHAWSLVREAKFSAPVLWHRYSSRQNIPWIRAARSLASIKTFGSDVKKSLQYTFDQSHEQDLLAWVSATSAPLFLSDRARALLRESLRELSQKSFAPFDKDRSRHQALESLVRQDQIVGQLNQVYQANNILSASPFLDPTVVELALSLPIRLRSTIGINKYPLYMAMRGIVPSSIFTRPIKGEYSASVFASLERRKTRFLNEIQNGFLASTGLVNIDELRSVLSLPLIPSDLLDSIERLAGVERWIRNAI